MWKREGDKQFAGKVIWEDHTEHTYLNPATRIDTHAAQELIDSLWECGIRPSEGSGSAGSLAATERHLADMQKLVFKGK
jgi:hypothetical protein